MGRVIGASSGINTFPADAVAADIRKGKTAVIDNIMVTGTYLDVVYSIGVTTNTSTEYTVTALSVTIPTSGDYNFSWVSTAKIYDGMSGLYKNGVYNPTKCVAVPVQEAPVSNGSSISGLIAGDVVTVYSKTNTAGGTICVAHLLGYRTA